MSDDKSFDRRTVLKALGTASAVGVGSISFTGVGAGEVTSESIDQAQAVLDSVRELEDEDYQRVVRQGRDRENFRMLFKAVRSDFPSTQMNENSAYAIGEWGIEIAQFSFSSPTESYQGHINIPIGSESTTVSGASKGVNLKPEATIFSYASDDRTASVAGHDIRLPTEEHKYTVGGSLPDQTGGHPGVTTESVQDGINRITIDMPTAEENVSTDAINSANCEACKIAMTVINSGTCGLTGYIACGIITSETIVGPLACATILPVACTLITNYGTSDPNDVCRGQDVLGNQVIPRDEAFC